MKASTSDEFRIDIYSANDEADMLQLWQAAELVVPWNNPLADIARKTTDSPQLFFTGRVGAKLVASCMAGYDGHRGWIYFLAVHPAFRRRGYAEQMVRHSESALRDLGCPKLDLMVRNSNQQVIDFYRAIGYDLDPVVVLSKRLAKDKEHDFS